MKKKYRIAIKRDFGRYGWWDSQTRSNRYDGFVVTNGGIINVMPGACWFKTIEDAFIGIEALEISEQDGRNFYEVFKLLKVYKNDRIRA
jgi:hypothetical protein